MEAKELAGSVAAVPERPALQSRVGSRRALALAGSAARGPRARDNRSMELHLDDQEVPVLRDLLKSALGDLSMEIANTDNAQFRAGLRRDRDLMKAVFDRLNTPS